MHSAFNIATLHIVLVINERPCPALMCLVLAVASNFKSILTKLRREVAVPDPTSRNTQQVTLVGFLLSLTTEDINLFQTIPSFGCADNLPFPQFTNDLDSSMD